MEGRVLLQHAAGDAACPKTLLSLTRYTQSDFSFSLVHMPRTLINFLFACLCVCVCEGGCLYVCFCVTSHAAAADMAGALHTLTAGTRTAANSLLSKI